MRMIRVFRDGAFRRFWYDFDLRFDIVFDTSNSTFSGQT